MFCWLLCKHTLKWKMSLHCCRCMDKVRKKNLTRVVCLSLRQTGRHWESFRIGRVQPVCRGETLHLCVCITSQQEALHHNDIIWFCAQDVDIYPSQGYQNDTTQVEVTFYGLSCRSWAGKNWHKNERTFEGIRESRFDGMDECFFFTYQSKRWCHTKLRDGKVIPTCPHDSWTDCSRVTMSTRS